MGSLSPAQLLVVSIPPILLALSFHECCHAWMADKLGDPTARLAGRLTLNPLKHLDFLGTLVFVMTRMIGWAKPVPVNHYNFKNPRRYMMWVALAGPGSNLLLALASAGIFHFLYGFRGPVSSGFEIINPLLNMAKISVIINTFLAVFNLIPIPPLDGGRILTGLLPSRQAHSFARLEQYGFLILLLLLLGDVYGFFPFFDFFLTPLSLRVINLFLGG